ncbi:ankyrin repeat domain-containing protein SOWAHC-like [Biomphalaria glabrata]|uniref:Ankyrin repeat domain-containing protein SOWAHC-like n=1 Tax=Biomphalaria glabrata TaxID=6526 RepID=A0A9W3AUP0_BIOGL|nr:ankyrin repeat domain-containing protein SOWAHC-like [Biomphalaria glabrata]XP_055890936.1 ankyrin repeat domain-containing protein SOWAHC-like [Biomphalaria glabrata]KAI8763629.1 ankyrin repeat domain-containing protein SOWAHC-like [Biomphalaria glabrata]
MGDFEIDAVLQFMLSKGGRVRNHELVTHFKNVLNHPVNKALNRERFKDYVNELATIKLDLGEKVLVLKKKYRPASENLEGSDLTSQPLPSLASSVAKTSAPKPAMSEPNLRPKESSVDPDPPSIKPSTKLEKNDSLRAQSEPPATPTELKKDHLDGLAMSRMKSDENMKVNLVRTDRVEPSIRPSGSNASLASTESHRSTTSSTSETASMDDDVNASVVSVKDKIIKMNNMSVTNLQLAPTFNKKSHKVTKQYIEDDDASHSSGQFYVALTAEQKDWLVVCSSADYQEMNRLLSKNNSLAKLRDFTNVSRDIIV